MKVKSKREGEGKSGRERIEGEGRGRNGREGREERERAKGEKVIKRKAWNKQERIKRMGMGNWDKRV